MRKTELGNDNSNLKNRVFYLDVKTAQNRAKLRDCITKLRGTVSEFLDTRVKYLVTDRHEKDWPQITDKSESSNNVVNTNKLDTPVNTPETPVNRIPELLPRGKLLALRVNAPASSITLTPQSSKASSDVIEIALRRGIKILTAQVLLAFCSNYIREFENPSGCDKSNSFAKPHVRVKQLNGNFIKIEDTEQKYKPQAKEFKEWPKINFDSDPYTPPFGTPSKVLKLSENRETRVRLGPAETGPENIRVPPTPETSRTTFTGRSTNTRTIEGLRIITPKLSNQTNDLKEIRPSQRKKVPAVQFCDNCYKSFTRINEHIISDEHQKRIKHKENYKDLLNVIKSLPKWTDMCPETTDLGDSSDNESEYESNHLNYPSLTPPSMSSTIITLTPGSAKVLGKSNTAKGTFLPLHDYIAISNKGVTIKDKKVSTTPVRIINKEKVKPEKFNLEQLFSDDEENDDEIEPSCFTPPFLPPLLYPQLDMPEEMFDQENVNQLTDQDYSLEF